MYVRVSPSSSSPTRVILKFLSSSVTRVRALAVGILLSVATTVTTISSEEELLRPHPVNNRPRTSKRHRTILYFFKIISLINCINLSK